MSTWRKLGNYLQNSDNPNSVSAKARLELMRRNAANMEHPEHGSLIKFIKRVAPWFIVEEVHLAIAERLEAVVLGEIDRLMVYMPPRTGKSMLASIFFPAWYMGLFPDRKVMQCSYSAELAVGFGRQVRNLVQDRDYQSVFPGVNLRPDNKAAGRWALTGGGEYFAAGVGGGIAGKGFNIGIIDDPLSEQDAYSQVAKDRVWEWYGPGFYTRRQPGGAGIVYMGTRWALDDLAGRLVEESKQNKEADRWEILSIPAILNKKAAAILNRFTGDPLLTDPDEIPRG